LLSKLVHQGPIAFVTREMIRLRDVETGDLAVFFEHQRDPVAVAMVAFNAHWAKLLADDSNLKKTVLVDGWQGYAGAARQARRHRATPRKLECLTHSSVQPALFVLLLGGNSGLECFKHSSY
jgi:hypothetical protein